MIDHGGSKPASYLRTHRLRLTLWIGAIEGFFALIGWIPNLAIVLLTVVAVGFFALVGRKYESSLARHLSWIFAGSQLVALVIPAVLAVAEKFIAVGVVAVIVVVALIVLFTERERL